MLDVFIRVAATCALVMAVEHPASAQTTTRFDHNGSQMIYAVNGDRAVITYAIPRSGLSQFGIAPGTTLFEGRATRGLIRGVAYTFSRECPPAPYEVQGMLGETLVLDGAAPQRGPHCAIVGYRTDLAAARLVFQVVLAAVGSTPGSAANRSAVSAAPALQASIVVDYRPGVGDATWTPTKQALNEAMPRHLYLKRLPEDYRELHVAWQVRPVEGDAYPAQPNLFGSDTYPSGTVVMAAGLLTADIVIRTVRTNRPDWARAFEVVLTDAKTGQPVLSTYHTPITVGFSVAGDLKCKVGRADRCDPSRTIPVDETPVQATAPLPLRTLLSAFCAAEDIRGSECLRAKNYRPGEACHVKLTGKSTTGRFIAASGTIVIADYQSECEPHATEYGGSVLFQQTGDVLLFKGFEPGYRIDQCVVTSTGPEVDKLICIMSHTGYGQTVSTISELVLVRPTPQSIRISHDDMATASISTAGNDLTRVSCGGDQHFESLNLSLSKLAPGPVAGTITAELEYADEALIKAACAAAASEPDRTTSRLYGGDGFIPQGGEKHRRIVVDLTDRSMTGFDDFKAPRQALRQ